MSSFHFLFQALDDDPSTTLDSLSCVCEILYKNCIPVDWEENLLGIAQLSLNLITALMPSVEMLDARLSFDPWFSVPLSTQQILIIFPLVSALWINY